MTAKFTSLRATIDPVGSGLLCGVVAVGMVACGGTKQSVAPVDTGPKVIEIRPRQVVAEANADIQNGEYAAAVEKLSGLLDKQPDNTVALYNRAYANQRLGNWREAEAGYREVLAATPEDTDAVVNLSAVLKEQGKNDAAAEVINARLESDPFNGDLLNNLSVLRREAKDYDGAVAAVRKLLMRDKSNVDAYKNLALVYIEQDKTKLAETILQNARRMSEEQNRSDPDIFVNLGMIYLGRNENGRAMAAFKKALELDSDHVQANYNIGSLALRHRDYGLAATSYELVANEWDTNAEVAASLGFAYQGQQEHAKAVSQMQKARELYSKSGRPENDQLLYQLVISSQAAGQNEKALSFANEYLTKNDMSCGPDDYDGFCGRYNGIKLTIEMAAEAEAEQPEEEEETVKATGRDIFTEETPEEGEVVEGEAPGEGDAPAEDDSDPDTGGAAPTEENAGEGAAS